VDFWAEGLFDIDGKTFFILKPQFECMSCILVYNNRLCEEGVLTRGFKLISRKNCNK